MLTLALALLETSRTPLGAASESRRQATRRSPDGPPVVVAVVESGGLNVLHSDFRAPPRERVRVPSGRPATEPLQLPSRGDFDARIEAARLGGLGTLQAGHLYSIRGTRIVGIYVPADIGRRGEHSVDIFEDRAHATGAASSAVGLKHGTDPRSLLVFVPRATRDAWRWLAAQEWIDVVSTSYYSVYSSIDGFCMEAPYVREIIDEGRLVFSASGNVEHAGLAHAPSGLAEAYQVGGVDAAGRTFIPSDTSEPAVTPTRPYETGDRFHFDAASSDSLSGSAGFGGTSGAAPSTAGRAAELVRFARSILGGSGYGDETMAAVGEARTAPNPLPSRGPLSDGDLTNVELVELLHHTAAPSAPGGSAFLAEGYGALSAGSVALAKRVLTGEVVEPDRSVEHVLHHVVETVRAALFGEQRCP